MANTDTDKDQEYWEAWYCHYFVLYHPFLGETDTPHSRTWIVINLVNACTTSSGPDGYEKRGRERKRAGERDSKSKQVRACGCSSPY